MIEKPTPEVGQIWRSRTHKHQRVEIQKVTNNRWVEWSHPGEIKTHGESVQTFHAYFELESKNDNPA